MSRNSRAARSSSSTSSSRLIPLIGFSIGDCLQRYHHGPRAWQSPLCHDALGLGGVGGAGIFVVDLARHVAERDPPYAPSGRLGRCSLFAVLLSCDCILL